MADPPAPRRGTRQRHAVVRWGFDKITAGWRRVRRAVAKKPGDKPLKAQTPTNPATPTTSTPTAVTPLTALDPSNEHPATEFESSTTASSPTAPSPPTAKRPGSRDGVINKFPPANDGCLLCGRQEVDDPVNGQWLCGKHRRIYYADKKEGHEKKSCVEGCHELIHYSNLPPSSQRIYTSGLLRDHSCGKCRWSGTPLQNAVKK